MTRDSAIATMRAASMKYDEACNAHGTSRQHFMHELGQLKVEGPALMGCSDLRRDHYECGCSSRVATREITLLNTR